MGKDPEKCMKGKVKGMELYFPKIQKSLTGSIEKVLSNVSRLLLSVVSREDTDLKVGDEGSVAVFGFDFHLCCLNTFTLKM